MPTTSERQQPVCDLSMDLDNKWAYLKTHGDDRWASYPSYFDQLADGFLPLLKKRGCRITLMVVGQDAILKANRDALCRMVEDGHELGNHSFTHEPWMQRYSAGQVQEELDRADVAITAAGGRKPVGFRGPGYSFSAEILDWLAANDYVYDGSTFPTFLGPAARTYYFLRSNFSPAERHDRRQLFGNFRDGFRSLRPFYWQTDHGELMEIPVSTMPILRTPFHFSYLHYVSQFSSVLAMAYLRWSLLLCRITGLSPSLLMHPLDFLGGDEVLELSFFPGMKLTGTTKRAFMVRALELLANRYRILTMSGRVECLRAGDASKLPRQSTQGLK